MDIKISCSKVLFTTPISQVTQVSQLQEIIRFHYILIVFLTQHDVKMFVSIGQAVNIYVSNGHRYEQDFRDAIAV